MYQVVDPLTVAVDNPGAFRSANDPTAIALRTVALVRESPASMFLSRRPLVGNAEAVGCDGLDEVVSRFDRQLAVAIDEARFAADVDLGKAEPIIADKAIARWHDFAPVSSTKP